MKNITKFTRAIYMFKTKYIYGLYNPGDKACLFSPMQLNNPKGIQLDKDVFIASDSWLMALNENNVSLHIGMDTVVGHYFHCVALKNVNIGNSVLIADKVFISDCSHSYKDISEPVVNQNVEFNDDVIIGDGTWIGENVCILGAQIGKHCVIGANSVVTYDIPDYSVAVGSPAKIIKKYDASTNKWIHV